MNPKNLLLSVFPERSIPLIFMPILVLEHRSRLTPCLPNLVPILDSVACVQVLSDSDDQLAQVWQHQLIQFSSVSTPVAVAIAGRYPSPASLMKVS